MQFWKVFCLDSGFPGLWRVWLRENTVAVGWFSKWNFRFHGGRTDKGWKTCRPWLGKVHIGDLVAVHLRGNRIGRLGRIVDLRVSDDDWNPTVPRSIKEEDGELGRRILVEWLPDGPNDQGLVARMPHTIHGRNALWPLEPSEFAAIRTALNDRANWVRLPLAPVAEVIETPIEEQHARASVQTRAAGETPLLRREAALLTAFRDHRAGRGRPLTAYRIPCPDGSTLRCDAFDGATCILFEAKGTTERGHLRMAIGQLMDYRRLLELHLETRPRLAVLTPIRPDSDAEELLTSLNIGCVWQAPGESFADNSDGELA